MKESFKSKTYKRFFKIIGVKKRMGTDNSEKFFRMMNMINKISSKTFPKSNKEYKIEKINENIIKLIPKDYEKGKIIIFSNGGAWVGEINKLHWTMLKKIAKSTKTIIYVSRYPLFHVKNGDDLRKQLLENYLEIEKTHNNDRIILMGDSAGGYNSLVLYELLKKEVCNKPKRLVLLSPCVDVSLDVEIEPETDKNDPLLSIESGPVLFNKIKGSLDVDDMILNPMKYKYDSDMEIDIYTGSHDILHQQAVNFYEMKKNETNVHLYTFDKMIHDFMMFGVKESERGIFQIAKDINNKNPQKSYRKEMLND